MQRPQNSFSSQTASFAAVSLLVLITLVGGLRLSWQVGLAGAIVTYLIVSLLLRRPAERFSPPPSASDLLTELTALSQKVTAHAIRLKIADVIAHSRVLLNRAHNQPSGAAAQQEYARDCLASAVAATRRFTGLSSHVTEPKDPAMIQFSDYLTALSQALAQACEEALNGSSELVPTAQIDRYQARLHTINQIYFGSGSMP